MNKLLSTSTLLVAAVSLLLATPVAAQTTVDKDAQSIREDEGAINKDNAAIQNDKDKLARERADKAADKANGEYGKQAVDSVKIGGTKTAKKEKKMERDADNKILNHDRNELNEDASKPPTQN